MYRIDILLKQGRKLFHTNDLALLWGIRNTNTLYTTIKRYVKKGILLPIHKGFYSTVPLETLDPLQIAVSSLHTYSYLSTESVLVRHGVIFQTGEFFTFVSSVARKFTAGNHSYLVRKMKDEFLYRATGVEKTGSINTASLERAVADMLYFQPKYHFDNPGSINWKRVKAIQKEVSFV